MSEEKKLALSKEAREMLDWIAKTLLSRLVEVNITETTRSNKLEWWGRELGEQYILIRRAAGNGMMTKMKATQAA